MAQGGRRKHSSANWRILKHSIQEGIPWQVPNKEQMRCKARKGSAPDKKDSAKASLGPLPVPSLKVPELCKSCQKEK